MNFTEHTTDEVLRHENARNFLKVLDALRLDQEGYIQTYVQSFNPVTVHTVSFLKKWLRDLGDIPTYSSQPRKVIEDLILNAQNIFGKKGTFEGLKLFIEIISCGTVDFTLVNLVNPPDFIIPDDPDYGQLWASSDDSVENDFDYNEYIYGDDYGAFLFLFEDNFDVGVPTLALTIHTPFYNDPAFINYVETHLKKFVPLISENDHLTISIQP